MYKFTANHLFIPLVSCFIFSCQPSDPVKKNWTLIPTGEILALELDDQTPNISMGIEFFDGEQPFLFNANWNTNSLQMYDPINGKLVKELTFDRQGDQGVEFNYFHVHSLDSIFVFPPFGRQFILTDTSGMIRKRVRFDLPEGYSTLFVHNIFYVSPPQARGKELVAKVRAEGRPSQVSQEQLDTWALLAAIDLESGAVRLLPQGFPNDYLLQGQRQFEYSILNQGGKIIASFMGDHRVYQTTVESADWEAKEAKSQFLDQSMPTFPKDVESRGMSEYAFAKSRYESLVWDPYRKVYYRFAYPTIPVESDDHLRTLRSSPGEFVVMALGENLEVLTERKFEAGIYYPTNFFVGEKGLYISLNHPDNPENVEDLLKFELIALERE